MEKYILTKKAQIWGADLMIAIVIFMVGIVVTYIYAINFLNEAQENLDEMFYEGNLISSLILSDGSPVNWTSENAEIPGFLTNKKINQTKLDTFYLLSQDYPKLKSLLGTKYEFYFNFTGMESSGQEIEGIGKPVENQKNLVRVERFTIYQDKPIKFTLFIWN